MKKYYIKNKQKILNYQKEYRKNHKDEIKLTKKKYSEKNSNKLSIKSKKWYETHKEIALERNKEYNLKNRDKISKYIKNYVKENIEIIKQYKKNYYQINKKEINMYIKNKLETDSCFKLKHYIRCRIRLALKGNPKLSTTMKLVGCSIEKLRLHLANQFTKGMNWDNYGKWHVDHIKPCASFDLSRAEEQRKCFYYINLQPLWAKENFSKNKY